MALLRGIETTAIGKTRTVEIEYERGGYVDRAGKKVEVLDMSCYSCMHGYFVLSADPIDYCPHCGRREGTPWPSYEDARSWAQLHEWKYMKKLGLLPFGTRRFDGSWVLGFARSASAIQGTGKFADVRCLLPGEG